MPQRVFRMLPRAVHTLAVVGAALAGVSAQAADVSSTWLGATGSWNDPLMWNPALVPNNGSQTFDAALSAGTANLASDIALQQLNLSGAALISPAANPFTITANEPFTWTGGRINNTIILANGGAVLNDGGVGSQFRITVPAGQTLTTNGGSIDMTRSRIDNAGVMHVNTSSMRFTTNPNNVTFWTGSFNNSGVMNLNASLTFDNVEFNNSGVINSNVGGVTIRRGGVWTGGRFVTANPGSSSVVFVDGESFLDVNSDIPGNVPLAVSGNGTATFDFPMTRTADTSVGNSQSFSGGAIFNAPVTFEGDVRVNGSLIARAGGQVNGPLTLRRRIGGVTINAPATFTAGSVAAVSIGGGIIHGPMITTNNAPISLETSLIVDPGTFNNHGPITADGLRTIFGEGLLNNTSTITTGTSTLLFQNELKLHNTGSINAGPLRVEDGSVLVNNGVVTVESVRSTGEVRNNTGATLALGGGAGLLTNLGRLSTGAAGTTGPSAGHFELDGSFFSSATQAGANPFLEVHLGGTAQGTEYDWFDINGSATMAGRLDVSFLGTFYEDVTAADTFTIVTSGESLSGVFLGLQMGNRIVTSDARGSFAVTLTNNSVVLGDFSTEIPEPSGMLAAMAATYLLGVSRGRRSR